MKFSGVDGHALALPSSRLTHRQNSNMNLTLTAGISHFQKLILEQHNRNSAVAP